ncbi:hypothetical protein SPRG_14071 [Saprolegnia parasitica CBS 223.65]|uniref:Uncharacterized protein n=1 Tax=Saprolegnia parasitica (strain CBS 223.65) TaxID=695850 RepID=A0A067BVH6_SAPPC|nr:hypothetical protein SPRG_14071 [Saprolegnia parasitica CBS 223.65]KDO20840.1 hypothetical protein SPRG_14071 [Saprolegnia parasitica CBS 223.65]|eukprot:XP_012208418.1 hypothetical protein SPRG_14071 [Saprolegnia parasitica CBS 223.65]
MDVVVQGDAHPTTAHERKDELDGVDDSDAVAQRCRMLEAETVHRVLKQQEARARIRSLRLAIARAELFVPKTSEDVKALKGRYNDARRSFVGLVPAYSLEAETMIEDILDLADKPKALQAELDAVRTKKLEIQQQLLLQEKNWNALTKLSSGQAHRVVSLEKEIHDLEAEMTHMDEQCHISRMSHQDWMNKIQAIREHVRSASEEASVAAYEAGTPHDQSDTIQVSTQRIVAIYQVPAPTPRRPCG